MPRAVGPPSLSQGVEGVGRRDESLQCSISLSNVSTILSFLSVAHFGQRSRQYREQRVLGAILLAADRRRITADGTQLLNGLAASGTSRLRDWPSVHRRAHATTDSNSLFTMRLISFLTDSSLRSSNDMVSPSVSARSRPRPFREPFYRLPDGRASVSDGPRLGAGRSSSAAAAPILAADRPDQSVIDAAFLVGPANGEAGVPCRKRPPLNVGLHFDDSSVRSGLPISRSPVCSSARPARRRP